MATKKEIEEILTIARFTLGWKEAHPFAYMSEDRLKMARFLVEHAPLGLFERVHIANGGGRGQVVEDPLYRVRTDQHAIVTELASNLTPLKTYG